MRLEVFLFYAHINTNFKTDFRRRVQSWQILCSRHLSAEGQGLWADMGAGPHTPLLGKGKREKQALPGTHVLCEHVLTGKRVASGACRADKFCVPGIRV